jgi:hypothetical protein
MTTQFNEMSPTSRSTLSITQIMQEEFTGDVIGYTGVTTVRTDLMGISDLCGCCCKEGILL